MLLLNKCLSLFASVLFCSSLFSEEIVSPINPNLSIDQSTDTVCFLTYASLLGDVKVVDSLLNGGYPYQGKTDTPNSAAYYAVIENKADIFYLLLEAGLKDEIKNPQESFSNWSFLSIAVTHKASRCTQLLISYGADVNLVDGSGHTALYWSVIHKSKESLESIIANGGTILRTEFDSLNDKQRDWFSKEMDGELRSHIRTEQEKGPSRK